MIHTPRIEQERNAADRQDGAQGSDRTGDLAEGLVCLVAPSDRVAHEHDGKARQREHGRHHESENAYELV